MKPLRTMACVLAIATCPASAQRFENVVASSGIDFVHAPSKTPRKYLPETMGGGVALLDADLDGRLDVFFVNGAWLSFPHPEGVEPDKSGPKYWNRLYLNRGDWSFQDATETYALQGRGYGMGAAVGDYDNDGDPDLLVTNLGTGDSPAAQLYRNDGGRRFVEVSREAGIDVRGWATSAGFFDADRDGDLDLLILRYMRWRFDVDNRCGMEASHGRSYCHPDLFPPESNVFYRNNGDGTFSDDSVASGIADHAGKGLGLAFADYDQDGWTDIAIANDSHRQFLFRNLGKGKFSEQALLAGTAFDDHGKDFAGMGILFEDLDEDGLADLLVTTLSQERYALFFNAGSGLFDYSTGRSGLGAATQLFAGWGLAVLDADADGRREVFFANGHVMDNIDRSQPHISYLQPPLLFSVDGRALTNVSADAGALFSTPWASRGAAVGDLDDNGLPDLVVSNLGGAPYLARNVSGAGNAWVGVRLEGCESNRDSLGAKLVLEDESGRLQRRTLTRSGSYLASRDPRVYFGTGARQALGHLTVTWPDGTVSKHEDLRAGTVNLIQQTPSCYPDAP